MVPIPESKHKELDAIHAECVRLRQKMNGAKDVLPASARAGRVGPDENLSHLFFRVANDELADLRKKHEGYAPCMATIESPYGDGSMRNTRYAMLCVEWASRNNYASYPSHLVGTVHAQFDFDYGRPYCPDSCGAKYKVLGREKAIALSDTIRLRADVGLFFVDFGMSSGMKYAAKLLASHDVPCSEIRLADSPYWSRRMVECGVIDPPAIYSAHGHA